MSDNNLEENQELSEEEKTLLNLNISSKIDVSKIPLVGITNQIRDWRNEVEETRTKKVYGLKKNVQSEE